MDCLKEFLFAPLLGTALLLRKSRLFAIFFYLEAYFILFYYFFKDEETPLKLESSLFRSLLQAIKRNNNNIYGIEAAAEQWRAKKEERRD